MQRVIQFLWINILLQMIEICSKYALTKTANLADSLYIADRKAREAVQLRKKWKKDFGGGGASPEIHVAQDSLGRGIKHKEITTNTFIILAAKDSPIPWIKRLAADDRRLQEVQKIKEDFAELAESVCIAHKKIREGKEMYAKFKKKMTQRRRLI